jgi:MraZ protein
VAVFCGNSSHTLDEKGRVFVSKRFQEGLTRTEDGTLVAYLSRGQDACLYLFSESGFQRALAELNTSVFSGEDLRGVKRVFLANTVRVELDGSGRILIPEKQRDGAGLGRDIVMVGVGDRAEIWPKAAWEKYEAANLKKLDHIDRVLAGEPTRTQG